jgi:hypothetical protein
MKAKAKEEFIGFRISREDHDRIAEQARMRGEGVNEWCRKLALAESAKAFGMTASERILLEEIGVVRHLFGRWLRRELPPEEYEKLRQEIEQHQTEIAEMLLERRATAKAM